MNIYFLEICAFYTFLVCFVLRPRLNMASWLATFQRGQNNGPCYGHVAGHDEHVRNMAPTWPEHGPNMAPTCPEHDPNVARQHWPHSNVAHALAMFVATLNVTSCSLAMLLGHVQRGQ